MIRIKNIEFLRILMIFGIIMHHAFINASWSLDGLFPNIELFQMLKKAFWFANNGVEGFFIISGFLFTLTFKKVNTFVQFVSKKYLRLAPVILFATGICFIASLFSLIEFDFFNNLLTVLLVNNFIIRWGCGAVGSVWYVSVLMTCYVLFFPIKKYVVDAKKYCLTLFLLTVFGYLMLEILRHGNYSGAYQNIGILNVGFLRGLGGFGLGALLGEIYKQYAEKINIFDLKKYYAHFSLCEVFLISGLIWWLCFIHIKFNNIIFVLMFTLLFVLFILNKGCISNFFDKNIWSTLSKYVYSIFVTHTLIYKLFSCHFWIKYPEFVNSYSIIPVIINLFLVILLGIFTYHFIEVPFAKFLSAPKTLIAEERE